MAAQPGDCDGVQRAIQVPVAAAVEAVASALPAAGFERRDAGQRGECGFAVDSSAMRPTDKQLRSDDGDRRRTRSALPGPAGWAHQFRQLGQQLGRLVDQELDAGGDRFSVSTVTRCSTVACVGQVSAAMRCKLRG